MLEHLLSRTEQQRITSRAVIFDLIRIASQPGGDPHNRALAGYIRWARRTGISENDIKEAISEARSGGESDSMVQG